MKYLFPHKHPSPVDSLLTKGTILQDAEITWLSLDSVETEAAFHMVGGAQDLPAGAQHLTGSGPKMHFHPELTASFF